jgi:adenine phosphoribosyltransferase
MTLEEKLQKIIRTIPDFPKEGIQFKDITPLLADPALTNEITEALILPYKDQKIDAVAAIESRGFLFGVLMAQRLGCSFVMIRKQGKLPHTTISQSYKLEYGEATIEMHKDAISKGDKVVLHDDLLATGGTAQAAADLLNKMGAEIAGISFVVELEFLRGRSLLQPYSKSIVSTVKY